MENQTEERSTAELITEYAQLLWHWSWLLILLSGLAGGAAYYLSNRQTPIYQASALAMINVAPSSQDYTSLYYGQLLGESYSRIMTTRTVLEAVAERLGLENLPGSVQVTPIESTQLLNIKVTDTDPERAALIANTLVEVFSEQIQADQAARYADSKQNLKDQLDVLDGQIQTTSASLVILGQEIQTNNTTLTALLASETLGLPQEELDKLDRSIQQSQSTLQSKITQQAQLQTILQNYQYSHAVLLQSYESIRLAESQSSSGILLKDPAIPAFTPTQPQPLRSAMLAAVVGLILGAGIVFLIEFLDDTMRDPQEITRKWGIPVLGMIITYNASNGNELITETEPRSPVSEAFRSLRTNIQFASIASPIHTLVVTSPSPQDGKTLIAGNLACVLAQGGREVVVVDGDLRRPRVHKLFQLNNRIGLTDQFLRPQENLAGTIQSTGVKNLFALTSGSLPPNPSELLASQRMHEIVQTLETKFEVVILDVPPALIVTDANVLASWADGVLLVIRPSVTKRTTFIHAVEQLRQVKANIVGVILNGVDAKSTRYHYYRGYYQKYGRGYSYYTDSESSRSRKRSPRKDKKREASLPSKANSASE